jgi:hypothetical protein
VLQSSSSHAGKETVMVKVLLTIVLKALLSTFKFVPSMVRRLRWDPSKAIPEALMALDENQKELKQLIEGAVTRARAGPCRLNLPPSLRKALRDPVAKASRIPASRLDDLLATAEFETEQLVQRVGLTCCIPDSLACKRAEGFFYDLWVTQVENAVLPLDHPLRRRTRNLVALRDAIDVSSDEIRKSLTKLCANPHTDLVLTHEVSVRIEDALKRLMLTDALVVLAVARSEEEVRDCLHTIQPKPCPKGDKSHQCADLVNQVGYAAFRDTLLDSATKRYIPTFS